MDTMPQELAEVFKVVGVAAPLIGILFWLLKQATDERQKITGQFLKTLEETVKTSTEMASRSNATMQEIGSALRQAMEVNSSEHRQIMEMLIRVLPVSDRRKQD